MFSHRQTMAVSFVKGALIVANLVAFIAKLIFNQQANTISRLFPRRTGEVSDNAQTDLTPASGTFAIWGLIYMLQFSWIVYTVSLVFRPAAPDILPSTFYLVYMLSCFLNISWLIVWARQKFALSSLILVGITLALGTCLMIAYSNLDSYLKISQIQKESVSGLDVWCLRTLVQNGIMFYTAWVSIASCINFSIFLQRNLGLSRSRAGSIALTILLFMLVIWFVLENFIISSYVKYTFAEYVVLIIGLSGIIVKQWKDGNGNQTYVLVILILSILMFGVRLVAISFTSTAVNDFKDK